MGISLEDFSDPVAIKLLVILALFAMLAHTCAQDFFKKYIVSSLNLRPPGLTLKPGWRGWFTGWESACGRPHSERVAERSFWNYFKGCFFHSFLLFPTPEFYRRGSGLFPILDTQHISVHTKRQESKVGEKERTSERQSSRVSSTAVQNT